MNIFKNVEKSKFANSYDLKPEDIDKFWIDY